MGCKQRTQRPLRSSIEVPIPLSACSVTSAVKASVWQGEEVCATASIQAVDSLVDDPFRRGCRKLRGVERGYRIRVGEYRVVYQVDVKAEVVIVYHVRHRGKAYR